MNKTHIFGLITALVCAPLMWSCTADDDAADTTARHGLRFMIEQQDTRLTYSDATTSFDSNDAIGCVIATVGTDGTYTFGCNTQWKYADGYLQLEEDNSFVKVEDRKNAPTALTIIPTDKRLKFFFYYPYNSSVTANNWTAYPFTVNTDQSTVAKLSACDFLWTESNEITSATQNTQRLTFSKKMATILVSSDTEFASISFKPNDATRLIKGKQINLSSGTLSDYTAANTFAAADQILPYAEDDSKKNYRLVLPAQETCAFSMTFKLTEGDATAKERTIDFTKTSPTLTTLEADKIYRVKIQKKSEGEMIISIKDFTSYSDKWIKTGT